jgi:hypothetical protein
MNEYHWAVIATIGILSVLYTAIGWGRILDRMQMWFQRDYWTDYNTVDFLSWMAKAAVIIPGLVFGLEIWWLHLITLVTSSALIWASMRKSLPTLIAFNSLWVWISSLILIRHFMGT